MGVGEEVRTGVGAPSRELDSALFAQEDRVFWPGSCLWLIGINKIKPNYFLEILTQISLFSLLPDKRKEGRREVKK